MAHCRKCGREVHFASLTEGVCDSCRRHAALGQVHGNVKRVEGW